VSNVRLAFAWVSTSSLLEARRHAKRALRQHYPTAHQLEIPSGSAPEVIGEQPALETVDHIIWLAPEQPLAGLLADAIINEQQHGVLQLFRLIKALLGLG